MTARVPPLRVAHTGDPLFPPALRQWRDWYEGETLFGDATTLSYLGDPAPLRRPTLGLICSGHCPGSVLLETYRFVRSLYAEGPTIVGGFHSPMERTCLDTLLVHHVPVVYCPGRRLKASGTPVVWRGAIAENRLLLLSPFSEKQRRVDRNLARLRNAFVGALADTLFVPYARPGGAAASLVSIALQRGKEVLTLDDAGNAAMVKEGVVAVGAEELIRRYKKILNSE
jgi:predicted Rossmann fold nucleotide-binding protein DprA/Smf involved in DNA uptake